MKICNKCKKEKEFKEFNKNKHIKDGHQSWCKECVRKKSEQHYRDNIKVILEKTKLRNKTNTLKSQEIIDSFKEGKKCEKCGYNKYKCALEFHHKDPKQKEFNISSGGKKKIERIKEEIKKCVLLCSNCHREFHYLEKSEQIKIENFLLL
jgi:hypothetical protein